MIYHTFFYQHTCIYNICIPTHVVAKQNFILITNTFNPQIIYILFFKYYSNYLKEQHLSGWGSHSSFKAQLNFNAYCNFNAVPHIRIEI